MDREFTEEFACSIFRFRKVGMAFSTKLDMHVGELFIMKKIAEDTAGSDHTVRVSDIQSSLFITKPAVSQMLNSLERKGYIKRGINTKDRRKIVITLTPEGLAVMDTMQEHADKKTREVISRLGEENAKQLVELFNRFADICEELKTDISFQDEDEN